MTTEWTIFGRHSSGEWYVLGRRTYTTTAALRMHTRLLREHRGGAWTMFSVRRARRADAALPVAGAVLPGAVYGSAEELAGDLVEQGIVERSGSYYRAGGDTVRGTPALMAKFAERTAEGTFEVRSLYTVAA